MIREDPAPLRLWADVHAWRHSDVSSHRHVASFHADLRVVSIAEDQAMTAVPGLLPDHLRALLDPTELYRPDRAALADASTPPAGAEVFADAGHEAIARLAVAGQVETLNARFEGSLYVFDTCSVSTRVLVEPTRGVVFLHTFTDVAHGRTCATVWETIQPGPGPERLLTEYAAAPALA